MLGSKNQINFNEVSYEINFIKDVRDFSSTRIQHRSHQKPICEFLAPYHMVVKKIGEGDDLKKQSLVSSDAQSKSRIKLRTSLSTSLAEKLLDIPQSI